MDELAKHAMEGIDPNFSKKVRKGDIIVAGKNFGCGSSREQAPLVLKHVGISLIIAESFARIFYRNAFNIGLPLLICKGITKATDEGDELEVDVSTGRIRNLTKGIELHANPIPDFLMEIVNSGGLSEYYKKHGRFPWQKR